MNYLFKYMRHKSIVKRMTFQRLLNCMILCAELKARKVTLSSSPIIARINTCPRCNLKCPACQEIAVKAADRGTHVMTLPEYQAVLDRIGKYLLLVVLYDEGEPLLNPHLPDIIRHTESLDISTSVSTNLAMPLSDDYLLALLDSGLDRMTVSMDGTTQEIYGRYRIGGELALLKQNLERLLSLKERRRSKTFIEIQFIDFGFNSHEKRDVRDYARRIGADDFRALPSSIHGLEEYLADSGGTMTEQDHLRCGCLDIWSIAHIGSDGTLFPCDFGEDNGMAAAGSVFEEDFRRLWNAPQITGIRAYFNGSDGSRDSAICRRCPSTNRVPPFLR